MYNAQPTKDYCEQIGLAFAEEDFKQFAERCKERHFTQKNFDFVMREHAWRIRCLFNPKSYSYFTRIKIALYFLNPFAKGIK